MSDRKKTYVVTGIVSIPFVTTVMIGDSDDCRKAVIEALDDEYEYGSDMDVDIQDMQEEDQSNE